MSQPEAFSVYARFRPTNEREKSLGAASCTNNLTENSVVIDGHSYNFDGVFNHTTDQITMYNAVGQNHIKYVLDGFNSTIFAYGQTSSGKTHTMEGPKILELNENTMGLIPRIFRALDQAEQMNQENFEISIEMSMLEIYMERINDLLDSSKENLAIRGTSNTGFYVQDLTKKKVSSERDMINLYQIGCKNRTTAATKMNDRSSRSHSVLLLYIRKRDKSDGKISTSVFSLVDLAGSEKFEASGGDEHRREEGLKINQSLTTLGKVIKALTENMKSGKKDDYVPYRESVLTKLLKQSLSGNCLTSLILCCSPAICNKEETVSTLRFGERAKMIKHEVHKNIIPSVNELQNIINQLKRKLQQYESDVKIEIKEDMNNNADYIAKEEAYEEEIKLLNDKLNDFNEKHEKDLLKIKELEEEKSKLIASFPDKDSYEERIKKLEKKIELLTEELRKSHEENNNLKIEIGNLRRENESLKLENENMKKKNEITINQITYDKNKLEKRIEDMQMDISNLQQQIELKNKQYQEKMLEIQKEFSLNNFSDTLTNSQIRRLDSGGTGSDISEGNVINKLKKFLEENNKTIKENRQTIDNLTKEKIILENRIKEVEKEATEIKNSLFENYEEMIEKMKDDNKKSLNTLQQEIDRLTNDLTYYKQNYESKCVELENVERTNIENINRIKRQFRTRNIDVINQRETNFPLSKTMILNENNNNNNLSNDYVSKPVMNNLANLNKEKAKLEEEVKQLNEQLTDLDNKNDELEREISELKKYESISNPAEIEKIIESNKNMEVLINQLNIEKEKLNDTNTKLSRENNELKKNSPLLQNEIEKMKIKINQLEESLKKEKEREDAYARADYYENYNKLIEENKYLKQKCEDLTRLKDELTNQFNGQIELLRSRGLLQENEYRNLQSVFLSVEQNFTQISSYLSFDYEHFNILSYINGHQVSLFTGHQAPLYNPKPDRSRELMIEDFSYDYSIYFPSSINSNLIKESDMEIIRNDENLKEKCLEMIVMFLSIVGLRLEKQRCSFDLSNNKNYTITCRRLNSSPLVEDKLRHLSEYEYEIVITQILRHLRETSQYSIQNVLLTSLANEINIPCGPLNCRIVRNAFHDSWISLLNDKEVRNNLKRTIERF